MHQMWRGSTLLMDRQTPEYFAKVDLENERHYRSLAAESRDSVNVALFTEKANFYAQQAASRQPPTPLTLKEMK